jgi:hypothetical protein
MRDDFELTVSYPPNEGEWIDEALDDQIIDAVGQDTCGSWRWALDGHPGPAFQFREPPRR